ncbi:MAG TPA: ABC-type transport auxiliary lipoprotein family protein [Sphingomonas sp.]
MTIAPRATRLAGLLLVTALAGCVSLTGKAPPSLIRLTPAATAPAGAAAPLTTGQAIAVLVPSAPAEVATMRVPVHSGTSALSYIRNAQYADFPTRLFRDLLAETIRVRTGRPTLDIRDYHLAPGPKLSGRIVEYGLDSGSMRVVMVFDAILQRDATHSDTQRFEARVPISAATETGVGPALDQAANLVAAQVADWVGGRP